MPNNNKFLDYSGLQYFYNNLFKKFPDDADFGDGFTVTKDENGVITAITLNLGDDFKLVPGTNPGDPQVVEVDLDGIFVKMFESYVVPAGKTDTDNAGKNVLRINPAYLTFEYPDSNSTNLRLTVNVAGIGEGLAEDTYDSTDPTDTQPEGSIYYDITTKKLKYVLPAASASVRGGIKVGDGLEITASTDDVLKAKVDNATIEIDSTSKALKVKDGVFAPLGQDGLVDPDVLPSYVDDVIEGYYNPDNGKFYEEYTPGATSEDAGTYTTEITPEESKIYVDLRNANTYRWSGSVYVNISGTAIDVISNNDIDTIMGFTTPVEP